MAGRYLCETCFDAMTNHVVDVRGFEEAVCDECIGLGLESQTVFNAVVFGEEPIRVVLRVYEPTVLRWSDEWQVRRLIEEIQRAGT